MEQYRKNPEEGRSKRNDGKILHGGRTSGFVVRSGIVDDHNQELDETTEFSQESNEIHDGTTHPTKQ